MKYVYKQPQIQNEYMAWEMASAFDPYHEVKVVAETQGLTKLAGIIATEGERASMTAGYAYVDSLSVDAPTDPELARDLSAGKEKYEPVLQAAQALGNASVFIATERALAGERNAIVSGYQEKLLNTLKRNTSEIVLADDQGNFIPEPDIITEEGLLEFAQGHGYSRQMADKAWHALRQSPAIEQMPVKPQHPNDVPIYDYRKILVDSVIGVVSGERTDNQADINEALPYATPKSIQLLRDFAAKVILVRENSRDTEAS
jgi:hypothetical protein